ncbi:Lysophospholipid acyltransferase 5 [Acropora cervicornis]|uniref:Lysophospholipid acyltransferase 5 n=1 Tax=Acropora cervicornis TaxID=6130 RepID=A0AAD9QAM6_ACRCE|nr:Lysophospholipid acyltransferase 5 [Acropora cervicornis]
MDQHGYTIEIIAQRVGVNEPALRLMIGLMLGLPLAFLYRAVCYKKNKDFQHLFITFCGLWTAFFCFGYFGGSVFSLCWQGYLLTGYAFKTFSEDYSISWTAAHCVLCLRLIGLAWDYYDGNQDQEKLPEDLKKTAIHECPSLLQMASYTYFFGGFLVGPQFPMRKYLALIDGALIDKKDDHSNSRVVAGLRRFTLGLFYLVMYSVLQTKTKANFLITDEYDQKSYFYKFCYAIATTKVNVMKYQAVWLITEGSCIISGLGYNGRSQQGQVRWDGCSNVNLLLFETAYTFQLVNWCAKTLSTNKTFHWYVYKRLRFLGNKVISHFITLFFVALWHGIAPGYFLCFIGEFVIIVIEQQLLGLCRPVIKMPFAAIPLVVRIPVIVVGVCLRLTGVAFFLVPFFLRRVDHTHKVWLSLYYVYPIAICGWFVLYPTVFRPLARVLMRKSADPNQNK